MPEKAVGTTHQVPKSVDVGDHPQQPHDGQLGKILVQPATSVSHLPTAITNALDVRPATTQLPDQIGTVQVATRLADREEKLHGNVNSVQLGLIFARKYLKSPSAAVEQFGAAPPFNLGQKVA